MILYRGTTEYEQDTKKDIIFQTVDWDCEDAIFDEDEDEDNNEKPQWIVDKREFIIRCYGVMKNGTSISALIRNFKPYFYIQVPNNWKQTHATQLLKHLKQKLPTNNGKQIGYYKDAIIKCKLVTKKKFNWFTNDRLYNFVKITTRSKASMRKVMTYLSKRARERDIQFAKKQNRTSPYEIITCSDPLLGEMDFIQYETNIDPMLRFMHEKEINPAGWIKLKKNKYIINEEDLTNCQVEVEINEKYVSNEINDTIAPLIIANFDIECTSGDGEFPQAERPEDKVIQIGTSVYRYGEKEPYLNHMIVLGECDPIDNCILEKYNSERKVLKAWRDFIVKLDPDIITGYNIFGFDLRYLYERSVFLKCLDDFHYLGRLQNEKSKLEEKKLSSSALGDNFMKLLPMKGRVHIDLMKVIQKDHNLDSYKLENVATHFMGEHKDPVTPRMIFDYYKSGDPEKVAIVAKYCVQDCVLCVNLMNKLNIVTNNIGMANVCTVPLSYLFLRGQGIKIFSLVAKQCKKENFVLPVLKKVEDNDGYEGAIVLVAKKGIYLDTPIAVTDYSSLYPSSMISENLSHDSLVWVKTILNNKTLFSWEKEQDIIYTDGMENKVVYDNLPGREYENVEYDLFDGSPTEGIKIGKQICRYAQPLKDEDGNFINDTRAVLPRILQHLLKARKDTRKKIPGEEDPFKRFVLDGLQLAYKITCNSLYGQVGASTSQIYKKEIAASTTATGRRLLKLAKDNTEEKFQGNIKIDINGNIREVFTETDCVYGDSVTGDTPLLLRYRDTGKITIKTIESLNNEWKPYENFKPLDKNIHEKQQTTCNLQIWVENEWVDIKRVIRHKTKKDIFRINTHTGLVDVTEDHSLIHESGNEIKPAELKINETKLMHSFPKEFKEFPTIIEEYGKQTNTSIQQCIECKIERIIDDFYLNSKKIRTKRCRYCVKRNYCNKNNKLFDINSIIPNKRDIYVNRYSLTPDEAFVWGFFMGDGSCGKYLCNSGLTYSWALNNNNLERLENMLQILNNTEPIKFKILDTISSSGVYKLVPCEHIKYMTEKYRKLFYDKDKYKIVPDLILNSSKEIKESFFNGYYEADGDKSTISKRCDIKGKIGAQGLYYLLSSIGYNVSIFMRYDKLNIYRLNITKKSQRKNSQIVKKIVKLKNINENKFVYDIETTSGKFNGGIGKLVLKNTDSIFVRFKLTDPITNKEIEGKEALPICIELGKLAGKDVTKQLKPPHDLEYEKTFWPFILFSKKRYAGHLYEEDPEKYKMKSMGIVLKRRDNAPIVKHVYGGVLDIIMNDKDLKKAEIHLKNETKKVMEGKFNIDKFIISKTLRGSYVNRQQIAHAALVDRITERDPGNAPQPSDRIPYVYQYLDKKKEETIMNNKKKKTNEFIKEFCNNISSSSKRFENVKTFINSLGQKYCYLGKDQEDLQNSLMELVRNDKYNSIEYMIKTITNNKIKIIQGDKIEDPIFLQQNNLPIDYKFYITNQILKPVSQIFALEIEQLDGFKKHMIDFNLPEKKYLEKSQKLAGDLLFKELLREQENKEKGIQEITKWFKITKI